MRRSKALKALLSVIPANMAEDALKSLEKAGLYFRADTPPRFPDRVSRQDSEFLFTNPGLSLTACVTDDQKYLYWPVMDEMARRYNATLSALEWIAEEGLDQTLEPLRALLIGPQDSDE